MKEAYFTFDNIVLTARKLQKTVLSYKERHDNLRIDPGTIALLVLDMQKIFADKTLVSFIPSVPPIIKSINKLISVFERRDLPIIFTRHTNNPENAGLMSKWWRSLIEAEKDHSNIIDDFICPSAILIEKHQYDAFYNTQLESILKKKGIKQLVITGLMTNVCCDTTARSAFIRGFQVFFGIDATAAHNYQLHESSLISLSHSCAIPVLTNDIIKNLESSIKG